MPWLDPRVRCTRCGAASADEATTVCPVCDVDLTEAGTQCELRDWATTRQKGRARFVWRRWVLGWGVLLAGLYCVGYAWRGEGDPVMYALTGLWPVGGYMIGMLFWRGAEREYAAWLARRVEHGPSNRSHDQPT